MEPADIARISLFSELDEAESRRLASLFTEDHAYPGERPAVQGDFGYRFFVILDGSAVVRVDGEEVGTLGPGDFFGEMALLEKEGRRTAEVEAVTGLQYASLMTWEFRELLEDHPEIGEKVEAAIAEHRRRDASG